MASLSLVCRYLLCHFISQHQVDHRNGINAILGKLQRGDQFLAVNRQPASID